MRPNTKAPLLFLLFLIQGMALFGDNTIGEATSLELHQQAVQCLTDIKSDVVTFSKDHPVFAGIEKEDIRVSETSDKLMDCSFGFGRATKWVENLKSVSPTTNLPQVSAWTVAEDNAVVFHVSIQEMELVPVKPRITRCYEVKCGKRRMLACYFVSVGKDVVDVEAPLKAMIEKRLKAFSNAWDGKK